MKQPSKTRTRKVAITIAISAALLTLGATGLLSNDGSASGATKSLKSMASKVSPWTLASLTEDSRASAADLERLQQSLQQQASGEVIISESSATGTASMVRVGTGGDLYPRASKALAPAAKVQQYLAENGALFGIQDSARQLKLQGVKVDQYGHSRVSFQQVHEGVPVLGAVLRGHVSADGRLTAVNGTFVPDVGVAKVASIANSDAARSAVAMVAQQQPSAFKNIELTAKSNALVVYRSGLTNGAKGDNYLAYEVQVTGNNVREFVYIDALTGKVVDQITGVHSAKYRELYQGAYNPPVPPVWKEGDLRPDPSATHEDEISGTGYAYNLFFNLSGGTYRSWDGADAPMRTVDTDPTIVCPNANWNGTTTNYCIATASDDVVGHEWAHAYTQETSGLIYSYQSGALNESYSDIFGETIDLINNRDTIGGLPGTGHNGPRSQDDTVCSTHTREIPTSDDSVRWLMGEDALAFAGLPPVGDSAIRDMWRPRCSGGNLFLGDPGHVNSTRYHCASSDGGGVHTNSAINNRAYALLVDGDTVTHKDDLTLFATPVTVTGIGMTKAAHIFWRANSVYNTPSTNFAANADSLLQACQDLKGTNLTKLTTTSETMGQPVGTTGNNDTVDPTLELSGQVITQADCDQVANAIAAVEMRFDVTKKCGFKPPLDPAPAPMCGGATVRTKFSQNWENGSSGWTTGYRAVTNPSTISTVPWFLRSSSLPKGRTGTVMYQENRKDYGNCASDDESGAQFLESPAIVVDATSPSQLVFDHYFVTEANYDGGNVQISINGGAFTIIPATAFAHNPYNGSLSDIVDQNTNPKGGEEAFHGSNPVDGGNEWGQSQINLAAAGVSPGDTIRLRWEFGQDGCNGVDGWYVDNVQVFSCGDDLPPVTRECTVYPADMGLLGVSPISNLSASATTASVGGMSSAVTDVNVRDLEGFHTYMADLKFTLQSPAGTTITLFDGLSCAGEDGISAEFDDSAASVIGCSDWLSGGTFKPFQALSTFNGENANGDWTLTITDRDLQDEGFVESWSLELCREVTPPDPDDGGDKTTGGGWLEDSSGGKINFGFNAKKKTNGSLSGNLQLNDKGADVKIHLKTVTAVGPVQGSCGGIADSAMAMEFRGTGTYNNGAASFRACVVDNGEPGNSKSSATPDRFHVECTAGCSYSTAMRAADDRLDGGNLQVKRASSPPPAQSSQSSQPGSASTLILDPVLMSEGLAGSVQLFEVQVYDGNQQPLAGQSVSLTRASAGTTETLTSVAGATGRAVFSVVIAPKASEFQATSGNVNSNAVSVRPLLQLN